MSPANAADPDNSLVVTFNMSGFQGNLLSGGSLPAVLPDPAAVKAAGGSVVFSAGASAVPFFSYTGQNCAATTSGPPPTISAGGVTPLYSTATTVEPGSWISIFGGNLASGTATWNGDFPISLGGTSVTIDGKAAYLWYVSPGQINLQVPDDPGTGTVAVTVTTGGGSATGSVTLGPVSPSFSLLDAKHVAGIILRSDGSGAFGGGAYDILGPTGTSLGYKTVAAKAGDTVELFGVGFGPTNPTVQAGKAYAGAAATTNPVVLSINNVPVTPTFAGMVSAGLYQINLVVPSGLGSGDLALQGTVAGSRTPSGVVIALQ
jgi:uncharacterized protein (TIGR03437 family)